jgi:hypothetical protein
MIKNIFILYFQKTPGEFLIISQASKSAREKLFVLKLIEFV